MALPRAFSGGGSSTASLAAYVRRDGTTPLTGHWTVGAFNISSTGLLNIGSADIGGTVNVQALATGDHSIVTRAIGSQTGYLHLWEASDGTDLLAVDVRGYLFRGANRFVHDYADATSDGYNLFIGELAGNFTMGPGGGASHLGAYNLALGENALQANTAGYYNTAFGFETLKANTTGFRNVALGTYCLPANTDGHGNVAIGTNTLFNNTTGYNNLAIGTTALYTNTTGYNNLALGVDSLRLNTTGVQNLALGINALYANTTGNNNLALGVSALQANTVGNYNVALSAEALKSNTDGNQNTAIGYSALLANTTGDFNIGVGVNALLASTTGDGNIGVGVNALYSNTTGGGNVAVGWSALYSSTTGLYNIAIGGNALFSETTGSGNIRIGAAPNAASYGEVTTGSQNISIGYDVAVASPTASYQLCIGNLIYGQNLDGTGATISTGGIGIGTKTPTGRFDILDGGFAGALLSRIIQDDQNVDALSLENVSAGQVWRVSVRDNDTFRFYDNTDGRSVLELDGSGAIHNPVDSTGYYTGASDDLRSWHDGTGSRITNATGILYLENVANAAVVFETNDTQRGTITAGGLSGFGGTGTPVSGLEALASFGAKLVTKVAGDSPYTAADEHTILCDATAGTITVNLPAASGVTGRIYVLKKIDSSANAVTIDGNASETIDGSTTWSLPVQYDSIAIQSDGSNWHILG